MADYRIYFFGIDAALLNTVTLTCVDDDDAVLQLKIYAGSAPRTELWSGERRVLTETA